MEHIDSLLDAVHGALREGRLSGLATLSDALETALAAAAAPDRAALEQLAIKARRNARALEAAARGVRAAQRRLAEIGSVQQGFVAYGPSGARDEACVPTQLARRF